MVNYRPLLKFKSLVFCLCSIFVAMSSQAHAAQYYRGPLVQASRACFHGDTLSVKQLEDGASKGEYSDVQAYAAYWVCKRQPEKALPWLKKSSDMGDGWASQMLAHYWASSPIKNFTKELKYLNRSALQGNAWAARALATIYLNGQHGITPEPLKASYWAQYAEDVKEVVPNTFYLAASYRNGWGVPKNPEKAKQLYIETMTVLKNAADRGDPYADMLFYKFYTVYSKDVGMKKDAHQADYWLHQAADKGYPPAIAILHAQTEGAAHE